MEIVESLIKFLHVIVSIILIIAILLQPGKGGDLGSMFGGGSSESVFGSSGSVPFLAKLTRVVAIVFFATSLSLGYFALRGGGSSVIEGVKPPSVDLSTDSQTVTSGQLTQETDNPSQDNAGKTEEKQ